MKTYFDEYRARVFSPFGIFLVISITLLLSISGAFGTSPAMSIWERLIYWFTVMSVAVVVVFAIKTYLDRNARGLGFWQGGLLLSTLFTASFTPMLYMLAHSMTGDKRAEITPIWIMLLVVFGVSLVIMQAQYFLEARHKPRRARLFDRLDWPDVHNIWRVTVRDHYVDVHTDKGIQTLLMRFSDALSELDGIEGLKVHRSHWVANEAIKGLENENGRLFVKLADASLVPVSRAYRQEVEARLG